MGQFFSIISSTENRAQPRYVARSELSDRRLNRRFDPAFRRTHRNRIPATFVDLNLLPKELALNVLSNLNATDLCLAACVWRDLGSDDLLWQQYAWCFTTLVILDYAIEHGLSAQSMRKGMRYMLKFELLSDDFDDLVSFFHTAVGLDPIQKRRFLLTRPLVFDRLINLKDFKGHFLPNALRRLFEEFPAPLTDSSPLDFVSLLVSRFSERYVQCNPSLGMSKGNIFVY
ncbi:F-box protein 8 [Paragonimus westermani]|uniref:F-box protein 8 n=1 Tax=Paragonimus westermani TaxID=34504 RepID=A0A5J4NIV8_9TREM|nr:F-box protein 8 [Paragonimus westermani]